MKVCRKKFNRPKLSAVDLFSGCGGLTQGLCAARFRVAGAIEFDRHTAATYRLNHPSVDLLEQDIRAVDATAWMIRLGLERGELGLLAGCPPCQGFSTLRTKNGGRRNADRRNTLAREVLRFTKAFLPKVVMMENVPGLVGKLAFRELITGLMIMGYETTWAIRDVARYSVPQRRRRLILLAGHGFTVALAEPSRRPRKTVRMTIEKLPSPLNSGDLLHDLPETRSPHVKQLITRIPKDGGSRAALPSEDQLACHKDFDGFKDIYGRMTWDKVAPTVTGGCFNPSKGRFLHPQEDRCITLREAALLQSFPRWYRFDLTAGKLAIARMIGNALPPEFIRRHALPVREAILKHASLKDAD